MGSAKKGGRTLLLFDDCLGCSMVITLSNNAKCDEMAFISMFTRLIWRWSAYLMSANKSYSLGPKLNLCLTSRMS